MYKEIPDFNNYLVTENGEVYSKTTHKNRRAWKNRGGYLYVDLWDNGKSKRFAIHQLVARCYCDNPNGYNEVDHIDKNKTNNNYKNLRWVTHKENLHYSYDTMSPVRNYRECSLIQGGVEVGRFKSINDCCLFASNNFGLSYSTLNKYRKVGDYVIRCND